MQVFVYHQSMTKIGSQAGRMVYSSDPELNRELNRKCVKCKEYASECSCAPEHDPKQHQFVAVLRIEKQGRGGKTVTVIDRLPKNEIFLKELTTRLKKKCGAGGTYLMDGVEGVIEIQGERRDQIRVLLQKENIKVKG